MTSLVPIKEEAKEGMATKPILAISNENSGEIVQWSCFPRAGFQEILSLFPSTKAFNVERILFTFKR
jgi:hypothetical protein